MENKIPLPTDNIYKFYSLFGLLTFIFCIGGTLYVARSTNELIFAAAIEYETLKTIEKPTPVEVAKQNIIEKKLEIAINNKVFLTTALGIIIGLSALSMYYGFRKWHLEIQPIQDETARLQLEKLRHEVQSLTSRSIDPAQEATQSD